VEPKRQALNAANDQLNAAMEKLTQLKVKISALELALSKLTAEFEKATQAKLKCQQEADHTTKTINLANRLVGGLASENVRWAEAVAGFKVLLFHFSITATEMFVTKIILISLYVKQCVILFTEPIKHSLVTHAGCIAAGVG